MPRRFFIWIAVLHFNTSTCQFYAAHWMVLWWPCFPKSGGKNISMSTHRPTVLSIFHRQNGQKPGTKGSAESFLQALPGSTPTRKSIKGYVQELPETVVVNLRLRKWFEWPSQYVGRFFLGRNLKKQWKIQDLFGDLKVVDSQEDEKGDSLVVAVVLNSETLSG